MPSLGAGFSEKAATARKYSTLPSAGATPPLEGATPPLEGATFSTQQRQLVLQGIKEKVFGGGREGKQAPANTFPMSARSGPIGEIAGIRKDQDSPRKGLTTFWMDGGHCQGIIQLETRRGSSGKGCR